MTTPDKLRWIGLRQEAAAKLEQRDYSRPESPEALAALGLPASEIASLASGPAWIPGVELLPRKVFAQPHRGQFGELMRVSEGRLAQIKLRPKQWAAATMFAGTSKGFHIHPPHIPAGSDPGPWFKRLYLDEPDNFDLRPYEREQWDIMFFVHGRAEMFLVDERAGLPRRRLCFRLEGDTHQAGDHFAVIIPPGVAHALNSEGSENLVMVYGTTTIFDPANEGRIASGVEKFGLHSDWESYWSKA